MDKFAESAYKYYHSDSNILLWIIDRLSRHKNTKGIEDLNITF